MSSLISSEPQNTKDTEEVEDVERRKSLGTGVGNYVKRVSSVFRRSDKGGIRSNSSLPALPAAASTPKGDEKTEAAPAPAATLYLLGVAARAAFQKTLRKDLPIDNETRQQLSVESERFELWATNLGVFVAGHGSLDYRIRQAENIKDMLQMFLSGLTASLTEVIEYADAQTKSPTDGKTPSDRTSSDDGWEDDESILDLLISSIRDALDRLYKLSTWIRNPSSRFTSTKALQHSKVDLDTGVDLLVAYRPFDEDYITSLFLEYQENIARKENAMKPSKNSTEDGYEFIRAVQPENPVDNRISENAYLVSRLVEANFRRRQLFSYWKRHREKLARHSNTREELENAEHPGPRSRAPPMEPRIPSSGLVPFRAAAQSVTTATVLKAPQQLVIRDDRSSVSVSVYAPSMYQSDKELLQFPRPPSVSPHEKFFECPFCFTLCPKAMLADEAWKAHIIHDIRPYVCTYRDCKRADELYDNRRDWIQHENSQHRAVFRCPLHADQTFNSIQEFRVHVEDGHMETDTDIPQDALMHASQSTFHLPDRCCPVCNISLETQTGMQSHIARHLERIALFSIPRYVTLNEQSASGQGSDLVEVDANGSRDDDFEGDIGDPISSANIHPWSQAWVQELLIENDFSAVWQEALTALKIYDDDFLELGVEPTADDEKFTKLQDIVLSQLGEECNKASIAYDQVHEREEFQRLRTIINKIKSINPSLTERMESMIASADHHAFADLRNCYPESTLSDTVRQNPQWIEIAVSKGSKEMVKLLLTLGCTIDEGNVGARALNMAMDSGHLDIARLLLDTSPPINLNTTNKDVLPPLIKAAQNKNDAFLRMILQEGADVNIQDSFGQTPLIHAVTLKLIGNVNALIDTGKVNIDLRHNEYETPLYMAVLYETAEIVRVLLSAGADPNAKSIHYYSPLYAASMRGHKKIVKMLLNAGADVNAQVYNSNALYEAAFEGYEEIVKMLLDMGANVNLECGELGNVLCAASFSGHKEIVKMLLNAGANVNAQVHNSNALYKATFEGYEEIVKMLLDAGANVNLECGELGNVLCAASFNGHKEIVKMLLNAGANVNAQVGNSNALYKAASRGNKEMVEILLNAGANVNLECGELGNALCAASYRGYKEVVKLLLSYGADPESKDKDYGNALRAAVEEGHDEIIKILVEAGAKHDSQTSETSAGPSEHYSKGVTGSSEAKAAEEKAKADEEEKERLEEEEFERMVAEMEAAEKAEAEREAAYAEKSRKEEKEEKAKRDAIEEERLRKAEREAEEREAAKVNTETEEQKRERESLFAGLKKNTQFGPGANQT